MNARLRGHGHIVFAVAFVLLVFAGVLLAGQWQAKDYKGRGLGLYVADGDTITTGYIEADTVRSEIDSTALLWVHSEGDGRGYAWFSNPSLSTSTGYYGTYGDWTKTGGASDHNDQFAGFTFYAELDDADGSVGSMTGFQGYAWLTDGQVGSPDTTRFLIGGKASAQMYGGTVYGTVIGHYGEAVATGAADTVSGNLMGLYSYTQAQHVGGTAYNIFMHDDTGTDWGIYQTGTSPNYLWGLDLGDSLTVAGNVHAVAYYGDGSNLTGVSGVSDHGSLTGLDDPADHPWALQASDFPDSFAVEWPDSFAAAMAAQVRPEIHDSLNARGAGNYTVHYLGAAMRQVSVTTGTDTRNLVNITGDTSGAVDYLYGIRGAVAEKVISYSITDGVLAAVDSMSMTGVAGNGGVFALNGYVYVGAGTKLYALSSTAGVLAKVDSTTTTGNIMAVHGGMRGDSTLVVAVTASGYMLICTSNAGDLTEKVDASQNSWQPLWDVSTVNTGPYFRINCAAQQNGVLSGWCDSTGAYTASTGHDPGNYWSTGVQIGPNGTTVMVSYIEEGVRYYTTDAYGNMALAGRWAPNYIMPLWYGHGYYYAGITTTNGNQIAVLDIDPTSNQPVQTGALIGGGASASTRKDMWDDGTYLYAARNDGTIRTLEHYVPWEYSFPTNAVKVYGNLTVDQDTLWVTDGAAYSYAVAGADWVTSSSRKLKHIMGTPGPGLGASILQAIVDMPIYWWRWKEGDTQTQHVGPVAEDFFKVGKRIAPLAATDSTIAGEHEIAALFVSVKELKRRNDSLAVELAGAQKRLAAIERAWGARASTGLRPQRPRLDKPPERPMPDPRPSKARR